MTFMAEEAGLEISRYGQLLNFNSSKFVTCFLQEKPLVMYEADYYFYDENSGIYRKVEENDIERRMHEFLESFIQHEWNQRKSNSCMAQLKVLTSKVHGFNRNPNYISFENGILDLTNFKLKNFNPKYNITIQTPLKYDKQAKCPKFIKFLEEVTNNDTSLMESLIELMGYCLSTETKSQKMFVLYGTGSNGKSVFQNILTKLIGLENISTLTFKEMEKSFSRASLLDKKLNLISDSSGLRKGEFVSSIVKQIVAGDKIGAEIKFGGNFSFNPYCKIVVATNQFPSFIYDSSFGAERRMLILPFLNTFVRKKQNVNLEEELTEELAGILNIALNGYKRLKENDFRFSYEEKSQKMLKIQKQNDNPQMAFIDERIIFNQGSSLTYEKLFDEYCFWLDKKGIDVKDFDKRIFSNNVRLSLTQRYLNVNVYQSNGKRGLKNISLGEEGNE